MSTFKFTSKQQILELIREADDYSETQNLINELKQLKQERQPFYLTKVEFDKILNWKLRQQIGRQKWYRKENTNEIIRQITRTAFKISHSLSHYETELKLKLLTALRGVGIPVASAILALSYPEKYAVIDFRGWRQLFENTRTYYSTNNYLKYLDTIRNIAENYNLTPQQVDQAIWQYDIQVNG